MKTNMKKPVAIALAVAAAVVLTGCGKASSPTPPVVNPPGYSPNPLTPGLPAGCLPITTPIGFNGTNVYFDSASLVAGAVPNLGQAGQMTVTAGGSGGPVTNGTGALDGSISMNVSPIQQQQQQQQYPAGYGGYYVPNRGITQWANISGTLTLSQAAQQLVMQATGGYGGYSQYPSPYYPGMPQPQMPAATQACVSGLALTAAHYNNSLYKVTGYLYLNNTTRGVVLESL